jgi:hypothetical protein
MQVYSFIYLFINSILTLYITTMNLVYSYVQFKFSIPQGLLLTHVPYGWFGFSGQRVRGLGQEVCAWVCVLWAGKLCLKNGFNIQGLTPKL